MRYFIRIFTAVEGHYTRDIMELFTTDDDCEALHFPKTKAGMPVCSAIMELTEFRYNCLRDGFGFSMNYKTTNFFETVSVLESHYMVKQAKKREEEMQDILRKTEERIK